MATLEIDRIWSITRKQITKRPHYGNDDISPKQDIENQHKVMSFVCDILQTGAIDQFTNNAASSMLIRHFYSNVEVIPQEQNPVFQPLYRTMRRKIKACPFKRKRYMHFVLFVWEVMSDLLINNEEYRHLTDILYESLNNAEADSTRKVRKWAAQVIQHMTTGMVDPYTIRALPVFADVVPGTPEHWKATLFVNRVHVIASIVLQQLRMDNLAETSAWNPPSSNRMGGA